MFQDGTYCCSYADFQLNEKARREVQHRWPCCSERMGFPVTVVQSEPARRIEVETGSGAHTGIWTLPTYKVFSSEYKYEDDDEDDPDVPPDVLEDLAEASMFSDGGSSKEEPFAPDTSGDKGQSRDKHKRKRGCW